MENQNNIEQMNENISKNNFISGYRTIDFFIGFIVFFAVVRFFPRFFLVDFRLTIVSIIISITLSILLIKYHKKSIADGIITAMVVFLIILVGIMFFISNGFTCWNCFG